jgi:hypothetical protein
LLTSAKDICNCKRGTFWNWLLILVSENIHLPTFRKRRFLCHSLCVEKIIYYLKIFPLNLEDSRNFKVNFVFSVSSDLCNIFLMPERNLSYHSAIFKHELCCPWKTFGDAGDVFSCCTFGDCHWHLMNGTHSWAALLTPIQWIGQRITQSQMSTVLRPRSPLIEPVLLFKI